MAYTPNIWVDREGTTRYFETVEKDGAKIFTPDYSQLTEIGTPVNADNMNHIEEGIAAGSFTKYDSNTVYQINDLVTSFEGSELKVYKSLKSENYNNPVTDTTYWEEVALGGGGSGFNLFDTKVSDHILEGEEAIGWALQGTYVYKNGVAGSRTGYPNFYNRCVEEYNNSILEGVNTGTTYTQPVNPTGITATSGWTNAINAFDGNASTYAFCGTTTDYIEWDLGQTLFISGFSATGNWVNAVSHASDLNIYKVNRDGSETLIAKGTGHTDSDTYTTSATFNSVACSKIRFRLNEAASTAQSRIRDIKITATLGIEILVNNNKHKFYPISQKPYIDSIYESTGIADFYGIDTENERIFLPRNDYFVQLTTDTNKVNETIEAGLPNIKGWFDIVNTTAYSTNLYESIGAGGTSGHTGGGTLRLQLDASLSNDIYGNSDTVQPPSSLKLLYYCVGNTKAETALSNVTEITTSENDTLPLFYNFYSKEDMTTTGAYVNASLGSWLSGNVYPTAYNELVNKLGTGNVKSITDEYTDYDFVVNQDDMTFRLPLLNGDEDKPNWNNTTSLSDYKAPNTFVAPQDGVIYYDFVNNDDKVTSLVIDGIEYGHFGRTMAGSDDSRFSGQLVINKGQAFNYSTTSNQIMNIQFVPYKGNGNLYYKVANAVTNLELLDVAKVTADLNTCYKRNAGDNSDLSGLALPSTKKISLTAGASGTKYTMPADGWFSVRIKATSASSSYAQCYNETQDFSKGLDMARNSANYYDIFPVRKGDIVGVHYGSAEVSYLVFYYAEGEV